MKPWLRWSFLLFAMGIIGGVFFLAEKDPLNADDGTSESLSASPIAAESAVSNSFNTSFEEKPAHALKPDSNIRSEENLPRMAPKLGLNDISGALPRDSSKKPYDSLHSPPLSDREELRAYQEAFDKRLLDYKGFHAALGAIHEKESRDDSWADDLESRIHLSAKSMPGFFIKKIECKSAMCRFEFEVKADQKPIFMLQRAGYFKPLADAMGKDVAMNGIKDFHSWEGYLLNLRRIEDYIQAFRNQYQAINGATLQ